MNDFQNYATKHLGMSSNTLQSYANHQNAQLQGLTPYIIEERQLNVQALDVFSRLMMDRIIFLGTGIDDQVANIVNAQLLFLENANPKKDVNIYINSPGGSVYAGLGIYDVMQFVSPEINTVCTGIAASMGAIILTAGAPKKRSSLPHARIMIHQPLGGAQGQASDIQIMAEEIQKTKQELFQIIADHTGQSVDKISEDGDRDYWMRATEARDYGVIDEVIERRPSGEATS
jgi:ATP-dependent Clp protease protease subunit